MSSINVNELSILVVEPSDTQRKIITQQLKNQGVIEVSQAKSVAETLAIVERHSYDLITSAMYFNDDTALDLLRKVRANDKIADTSLMLVTSEYKKENLEEFKQSGVIALLPKPFTHEYLSSAITNYLLMIVN